MFLAPPVPLVSGYVDANGKNAQYALDERHRIGVPGKGRNPWLIENEI